MNSWLTAALDRGHRVAPSRVDENSPLPPYYQNGRRTAAATDSNRSRRPPRHPSKTRKENQCRVGHPIAGGGVGGPTRMAQRGAAAAVVCPVAASPPRNSDDGRNWWPAVRRRRDEGLRVHDRGGECCSECVAGSGRWRFCGGVCAAGGRRRRRVWQGRVSGGGGRESTEAAGNKSAPAGAVSPHCRSRSSRTRTGSRPVVASAAPVPFIRPAHSLLPPQGGGEGV